MWQRFLMPCRGRGSSAAPHFLVTLVLLTLAWQIDVSAGEVIVPRATAERERSADGGWEAWVEALGSPSFHRRQRAQRQLRAGGSAARAALVAGREHPELEVRLESEQLLRELAAAEFESQLARLLSGAPLEDDSPAPLQLPGWHRYCAAAGDTPSSRALFARIVRDHHAALRWLEHPTPHPESGHHGPTPSEMLEQSLRIDTARLAAGDSVHWGLLLTLALEPRLGNGPMLGSQLRAGLLQPQVVEAMRRSAEHEPLQRLVDAWLASQRGVWVNSTALRIAAHFDRQEPLRRMAQEVLANSHSPPRHVATALLLLARHDPPQAARAAADALGDRRVAHLWHLVPERRQAVQTQVADAALAVLLHVEGIDPRQAGFVFLEADPLTLYREHSVGFEDEAGRRRAHREAERLLGRRGSNAAQAPPETPSPWPSPPRILER